MKRTILKFALMSIFAACTMLACDDDKKDVDDNKEKEEQIATQAQYDALTFLVCANTAFNKFPDETSAEYQQAISGCLQNSLDIVSLSFDKDSKPNNTYTTELYAAITETVNSMYQGQTDEVKAASIAGIQYMIYAFYQGLQSTQK